MTKMSHDNSSTKDIQSPDLFTPEFKRLKARDPPPDLSFILDIRQVGEVGSKPVHKYSVQECNLTPVAGLKPSQTWKVWSFTDNPGFIVIENPFVDGYQRYWVHRCLEVFPANQENITNLTTLGDEDSRNLWSEFVQRNSHSYGKQDPLRKLRWTTLGYHYNWSSKEYSEDKKAPFPVDVNCLVQYLAACLGFAPYQPQAAIINYYNLDSTLAGHTDHSEVDMSAPLFSISLGQTAVFLLGGPTKSVAPISLFLKSGDICVMSGQSRLAFHAVPRILSPASDDQVPAPFHMSPEVFNKTDRASNIWNQTVRTLPVISDCGLNSDGVRENMDSNLPSVKEDMQKFCSVRASSNSVQSRDCVISCVNDHLVQTVTQCQHYKCSNLSSNALMKFYGIYMCNIHKVNAEIERILVELDFRPFEVYLKSSRINLNVRQVLPLS